MPKPHGATFGLYEGVPVIRVVTPSKVEDAVWDAVEEAILAGWSVERFRRECASAWEDALRERLKREAKEWYL